MIIRPLALLQALLCGSVLVACTTTAPVATPTPSPTSADFTRPGAAAAMVDRLLEQTGRQRALTVEITKSTVEVTVLNTNSEPIAWAYRDGKITQVTTDQQYVDQATFDVSTFNISDIGGLFRAAEGQSGSASNQTLTIVDYSGGEVMMSVATVPESRTVFFNPTGSILPVLNFDTEGGIEVGLQDAVGSRSTAYTVSIDSNQGASVDYPGPAGTTVRRTRTSKVPVTTNVAVPEVDLPQFLVARVKAKAIHAVVARVRATEGISKDGAWSVVIDDRAGLGTPRMHFSIGSKIITTDLDGNTVNG